MDKFDEIVAPYEEEFNFKFEGFSCWRENDKWFLVIALEGSGPTDPLLFQTVHDTLDSVALEVSAATSQLPS